MNIETEGESKPARPAIRFPLWRLMAAIALVAIPLWGYVSLWPRYQDWKINAPVRAQLQKIVPMPFASGVSLHGLVKHIKVSTIDPAHPNGVPIYIDADGLAAANASMTSTVTIATSDKTLAESLDESLGQLGLAYRVKNGLVWITRAK